MGIRLRPWAVVSIALGLCAGLVLIAGYWRSAAGIAPSRMAAYLPAIPGVTLGIDVAALRRGGMLQALGGPEMPSEPEYKEFVQESEFNWETDLDYILARLTPREKYFLLKGRFDWSALRNYATRHGGACRNAFCELEGSREDRLISFFPLRVDVMALAVGPERGLAWSLAEKGRSLDSGLPGSPVWVRFRPHSFPDEGMSELLREWLRLTEGAEQVQLELTKSAGGYEALLEAQCRTPEAASSVASRLASATRALGALTAPGGEGKAEATVGQILAEGVFEARGSIVSGRWPIRQAFLEGILGVSR